MRTQRVISLLHKTMALNVVLVEETFYNQLGEFLHINKFASKKQNYKAWILQSVGMST